MCGQVCVKVRWKVPVRSPNPYNSGIRTEQAGRWQRHSRRQAALQYRVCIATATEMYKRMANVVQAAVEDTYTLQAYVVPEVARRRGTRMRAASCGAYGSAVTNVTG